MTKQNRELRYLPAKELRVATGADGSKTITGYAAVFSSPSVDFGGWTEMVAPVAFNRTLEGKPDVLCLYSHDNSAVLGRTKSGTLNLEVDSIGLKFSCSLPDTTTGRDVGALINRGDVDGCSFGFVCQNAVWTEMEDGSALRTLLDVTLYEITITAEPAYPSTTVALRSAPKEIRSRLAKTEKRDSNCECECTPCVDGDCSECTDTDCMENSCSCEGSQASYRNRAHMILTLAIHQAK